MDFDNVDSFLKIFTTLNFSQIIFYFLLTYSILSSRWPTKGTIDNWDGNFFCQHKKKYLSSGATKAFSEILSSSPISLTLGMNLEVNLFLLFSGIRLPIRQKKKEKSKTTGITLFIHCHSELKLMISFGNS